MSFSVFFYLYLFLSLVYLDRDLVDNTDAPLVFICDNLKIKQ